MMKSFQSRFCHSLPQGRASKGMAYLGLATLLAMSGSIASAQIADGSTGIDATGNAKSEMAACMSKARLMNEKNAAGSVAAGGVLLEAQVPVPAQ